MEKGIYQLSRKGITMKTFSKINILVASALLLSCGSAFAHDTALPADKVIASIQTQNIFALYLAARDPRVPRAVAANPGLIKQRKNYSRLGVSLCTEPY